MKKEDPELDQASPGLEQHYARDENAEEIINKYMVRAEQWTSLLEGENENLFTDLTSLTSSMPHYGKAGQGDEAPAGTFIVHMYFNAHNILKSIYRLYDKENSETLVPRFILLRSLYERMCAIWYLASFPRESGKFWDKSTRPNIKDLHNGFRNKAAAIQMYDSVYDFLCSNAHPDGMHMRSYYILRIYSMGGKPFTIGNVNGEVRVLLLEAYFNYYLWMVQTNLLAPVLKGDMDNLPGMKDVRLKLERSMDDARFREMKKWQDQLPTMSKFFDELGEIEKNYKTKIIKVKNRDDLLSRIDGIYELRNKKEHAEQFKQLFIDAHKKKS